MMLSYKSHNPANCCYEAAKRLMLSIVVLMCFSAKSNACQPCVIIELHNPFIRILSKQSTVENDILVPNAKIRVFRTVELKAGEKGRQELSCLSSFEIGKKVWSGKTDKNGTISLRKIPAGQYWIAIKSKDEEAVYVVMIPPDLEASDIPVNFEVRDGGIVMNKCGIEPIEYFFR